MSGVDGESGPVKQYGAKPPVDHTIQSSTR